MIPEFKMCGKCGLNKHNSEYHSKTDIRKNKEYVYLKSYCKDCSKICNSQNYFKQGKDLCKCGQEKTKRSKFCNSCSGESKRKYSTKFDVLEYEKYGKQVKFQVIRSRARTVIKNKTCCEKCGYDKHVEACHIKPISEFSDDTPIDVINDPSNLLALCPNCHWEYDNAAVA